MNRSSDLGPPPQWPQAQSPVWVVWRTTGEDPRFDALLEIRAQRFDATRAAFEVRQWVCAPQERPPGAPQSESSPAPGAAPESELGPWQRDPTEGLTELTPVDAWQACLRFAGDDPILVPDAEVWSVWNARLGPQGTSQWDDSEGSGPWVVGLDQVQRLLGDEPKAHAARERALTSEDPLSALTAAFATQWKLAQDFDPITAGLWAYGLHASAQRFEATDPEAARTLDWILQALNQPEVWLPDVGRSREGSRWLENAMLEVGDVESTLLSLVPLGSEAAEWDEEDKPIPPTVEGLTPFPKSDLERVSAVFETHLPGMLAAQHGGEAADYVRTTQRDVALRVAKNLGQSGLLLVHAPTGTGKTLAYLVPLMIWSARHHLRVGVATYTRALQEQAMESEVPRALAALRAAGLTELPRVALLKGRENYLCWRAFLPQVPEDGDDGETWLAWTRLFTFIRTDGHGDLDGFPSTPPIRLRSTRPYREALSALLRASRARKGCCTRPKDRSTCLADLARRRAERSHVVITNQSFVLARQEFLRHVVFDECEHLHDGAVSAWSHRFEFDEVRRTLARLYRPGRGKARAPLNRLNGVLPFGGTSQEFVKRAIARWEAALRAVHQMEEEAQFFERRRMEQTMGPSEREGHSFLRARMDQGAEAGMLQARIALGSALARLEGDLDRVMEVCEANPIKGQAAIRRQLELGRAEIIEWGEALGACLPLSESGPSFSKEVFYDVERRGQNQLGLVARVLLPFESLGRYYYPDLASAAFVSATTYLGGGFDRTKHYLGLSRCESPAADEERVGRPVETFRVPEVFDYRRVLVGVPRDSAPVQGPKSATLAFASQFIGEVAERTGGRLLALFTNLDDVRQVGLALEARLAARGVLLLYQGMPNTSKEELSRRFRARTDSVLLGVDTFWFGADFPGETLQYLVIARLPYGVPDRYHFAQCAALGDGPQRQQIYMPRALAKFRQGFGRLMRRKTDRGCVFVLDKRILEPRHREFLREIPLANLAWDATDGAPFVRGPKDRVLREAWQHMGLARAIETQGIPLQREPDERPPNAHPQDEAGQEPVRELKPKPRASQDPFTPPIQIDPSDLPF